MDLTALFFPSKSEVTPFEAAVYELLRDLVGRSTTTAIRTTATVCPEVQPCQSCDSLPS